MAFDPTSEVMRLINAAELALAAGDFLHADAIYAELCESKLLGAKVGALIVESQIARAQAKRTEATVAAA